jgi:hypothetical protein
MFTLFFYNFSTELLLLFFVGDAVLMIGHMEKIGEIEKTAGYNIYRIKVRWQSIMCPDIMKNNDVVRVNFLYANSSR